MKHCVFVFWLLTLFIVSPAVVQSEMDDSQPVLIANYHATFRAGLELRQMKGQAKVRNTSQFPIEFDDFRILVLLIQVTDSEYKADVVVERLEGSKWLAINTDALNFQAMFAAPTELAWAHEEYSLDLVVAVSVASE